MKKDKNIENFDVCLEAYLSGTDPKLHKKAIKSLLADSDLDDVFEDWANDEKEIEDFFLSLEEESKLNKDPKEKESLERLGKLSKEFYNKKQYKDLYELFFNLMFGHFIKFAEVNKRKDFNKLTDHDLYEKGIIPSEIFTQYFLMDSAVKNPKFDWNRSDKIMMQNLACLIICFSDIYKFMNE